MGKLVNKRALAEIFDISERTITGLLKLGLPIEKRAVRGRPHVFDTAHVVAWLIEREAAKHKPSSSNGDGRRLDLDQERAMLAAADRALKEQTLRARSGELVSASWVRTSARALCGTVRERFEVLPDRLSAILAAESDERKIYDLMAREIRFVLGELAEGSKAFGGSDDVEKTEPTMDSDGADRPA